LEIRITEGIPDEPVGDEGPPDDQPAGESGRDEPTAEALLDEAVVTDPDAPLSRRSKLLLSPEVRRTRAAAALERRRAAQSSPPAPRPRRRARRNSTPPRWMPPEWVVALVLTSIGVAIALLVMSGAIDKVF
jgi:hypothetical protein